MTEDEEIGVIERKGNDFWSITVHIYDKSIVISCGDATQSVKWLAHTAIARWDEVNHQGWKRLGIPTSIRHQTKDGFELEMSTSIREVIQNGDHIYVYTSLQPHETI